MKFPELSSAIIIEVWERPAEGVWLVSRRAPPDYKSVRLSDHQRHADALRDALRYAWEELRNHGAVAILDEDER